MGKTFYKNKHVLITGATEGLGLEMACELVKRGSFVSICSRSQSKVTAALDQLRGIPLQGTTPKVFGLPADVVQYAQMQALVSAAEQALGPVDIVIACAGLCKPGLFAEQDPSVFSFTMEVNYLGTVHAFKAALPGMLRRGQGKLVAIASAAAICGFAGYSSYAPSKWAQRGLCDALRNELLGTGVSVHIAYPPDMDTPGYAAENASKPKVTLDIDKALGNQIFTTEQVVSVLLKGIEKNSYHLPSPDFGQNMLIEAMNGLTPSRLWLPIRMLLAPILAIAGCVATGSMDKVAYKLNKQERSHRGDKSH